MCASKANQGIHSRNPHQQAGVQPPPAKQGSVMHNGYSGSQTPTLRMSPPFLLHPPALRAEHDVIRYRTSLWSAGVSCPGCAPSQLLLHPQSACWWGGLRVGKTLALCRYCSAMTETSRCHQCCFQLKSQAEPYTSS